MTADDSRCDNTGSSGANEFQLGLLGGGPGVMCMCGFKSRAVSDINVIGISGRQAASPRACSTPASRRLSSSGISHHHKHAEVGQFGSFLRISFRTTKVSAAQECLTKCEPNTSRSANDEVISQLAHFS
jgi:hypothetical protein